MMESLLHPGISRRRRFKTTHVYGSLVNFMLNFAVIISLWSLWSCGPDPTSNEISTSPPRQLLVEEQPNQIQLLVPVTLDTNGSPIYYHPQFVEAGARRATSNVVPAVEKESSSVRDDRMHTSKKEFSPSTISRRLRRDRTQIPTEMISGMSRTLFSIPSSMAKEDGETKQPIRRLAFLVAASLSLVLGALTAKKALEKAQLWEQQSREDSLAYDLAYTETRSDLGYGSFVSTTWSDELEKFDL